MPYMLPHYRSNADSYVSHLIGHEGNGSLLRYLQVRFLSESYHSNEIYGNSCCLLSLIYAKCLFYRNDNPFLKQVNQIIAKRLKILETKNIIYRSSSRSSITKYYCKYEIGSKFT